MQIITRSPGDNLVCDEDVMATMDESDTVLGLSNIVDSDVNDDDDGNDRVLKDKPMFAVSDDPITHIVYQSEWYCITTNETSTGDHYFAADIRIQF
ncbi:hypothetical protein Pmar_PMAR013953, partial [Perkinsus marinus ATCC 50983]